MSALKVLAEVSRIGARLVVTNSNVLVSPTQPAGGDLQQRILAAKDELVALFEGKATPWDEAVAKLAVYTAIELVAEKYTPGNYDGPLFRDFDDALAYAFRAKNPVLVGNLCSLYAKEARKERTTEAIAAGCANAEKAETRKKHIRRAIASGR